MQSDADSGAVVRRLRSLDHLVVQDIFLTRTAEIADVVLPAAAAWCESEGTVTNSERRVQRTRKALDPPGGARDDIAIIGEPARASVVNGVRRADLGRGAVAVADARRHELPAARAARRHLHEQGSADADQRMRAESSALLAQLTFQADQRGEDEGQPQLGQLHPGPALRKPQLTQES